MGYLPQRPLYKRLLIGGLLLGVVLVALGCWAIYSRSSLEGRIAAVRAAGDPATIADLAPASIPAEDNAATQLAATAGRFDEFSRELERFYKSPLGVAYDEQRSRNEAATTEQLGAIRAIVEKYPDLNVAVERAAACSHYGSRLNFQSPHSQFLQAMFDHSSTFRTVVAFVEWQMKLAVADGRSDLAVEKGIQLLRLGALYDAEPGTTNSLIAVIVRRSAAMTIVDALVADDNRSVTPELRQRLDQELSRFRADEVLRHSITTERALVISATQFQLSGMRGILANTVGLPMKTYYMEAIDSMEPVITLAEQPWSETFRPGNRNIFQQSAGLGVLANQLVSSLKACFDAVHRTSAMLRSLRVLNALQQYATEHSQEATGIADLKLPAEATTDPFTGRPLVAKHTEQGWVVYSIGKDGVDDGGEFTTPKDFGVGPSKPVAVSPEMED